MFESEEHQEIILQRRLSGEATVIECLAMDAITVARYWDKINPQMTDAQKYHFAFHTDEDFFLCTPKVECKVGCPYYSGPAQQEGKK